MLTDSDLTYAWHQIQDRDEVLWDVLEHLDYRLLLDRNLKRLAYRVSNGLYQPSAHTVIRKTWNVNVKWYLFTVGGELGVRPLRACLAGDTRLLS